jgi:hypothetical protein
LEQEHSKHEHRDFWGMVVKSINPELEDNYDAIGGFTPHTLLIFEFTLNRPRTRKSKPSFYTKPIPAYLYSLTFIA